MANRRYDDSTRFQGREQSEEELQRLRRGPREDMRPGSRAEWEQNQEDYARAQEAMRARGPGRSGREYARDVGSFYDELREERERPYVPVEESLSTSRQYPIDSSLPLSPGGRPESDRVYPRYGVPYGRGGPGYGPSRSGGRGSGAMDRSTLQERIRREALRRDQREPHTYDARYGPQYGHGPGVENMDPPFTGYSTSRSRADDHETGHGGYLGGGYGRSGRRDMPERPTGRGPKGYTRSDERIREDICERLMDAWMDAEHVDVRVKDGEVTLVGSVRTRDEKHAIENLAADVLGVKDVHNSLLVQRAGAREESDMRRPVEPTEDTLHS